MSKTLSEGSFNAIADFFYQHSGIRLEASKRHLVVSRLAREAVRLQCATLNDYVALILAEPQGAEARHAVDVLTTNETYFFRESAHFKHLAQLLHHDPCTQALRAWSAAASSGEEAYSIAMTLARHAGLRPWEVVGTDLSTRVVAQARQGLYAAERCSRIALPDLKRWCLRGEGAHEGQVLMNRELRAKVRFEVGNLLEPMPELGQFDLIFLRNVLIYFEGEAKFRLVANVVRHLKPGAYLYTGHAEPLRGLHHGLQRIEPSIYRAL
ncbi:MAG: protein-glutamate O-methyltransferase CheR [Burkholderiales bacterium]|nr:protein-glutamate O-methyltransferase CheR [Burkholderiales bacterium]